jgi:hypothetical protein
MSLTPGQARHGTNPASLRGLPRIVFAEDSAPLLSRSRHPSFDLASECPAGMRAGFAKATARIRGTGGRWQNLLVFRRMPVNPPDCLHHDPSHRCDFARR